MTAPERLATIAAHHPDHPQPRQETEMTTTDLPTGFGRRNPHCANCGDERGGPFGHETSECRYRAGMTAEQLAATMPPDTASRYWDVLVDRYLERELNR